MLHSVRYTCHAVLLPIIEGAFAAHDYIVETAPYTYRSGAVVVVLQRDATIVLLTHLSNDSVGEIEIWGPGLHAAVTLLETLPVELHKLPSLGSADTDG